MLLKIENICLNEYTKRDKISKKVMYICVRVNNHCGHTCVVVLSHAQKGRCHYHASKMVSKVTKLNKYIYEWHLDIHGFQNRTRPGGQTVKTGNRNENRFFNPKEPDFLLIPWTVKTGVGPQELVRTVRSNPLAIFFFNSFILLN